MREDPARDDYAPGPVYRMQKSTCSGWGRGVIRLPRSNSITWSGGVGERRPGVEHATVRVAGLHEVQPRARRLVAQRVVLGLVQCVVTRFEECRG